MLTYTLMLSLAACPQGPRTESLESPQFHAPVRLKAGSDYVKTEAPGYAAPCWFDVDGDGKKDLIVGQFAGGKMRVYKNLSEQPIAAPKLGKGEWIKAEGDVAEVPGVW